MVFARFAKYKKEMIYFLLVFLDFFLRCFSLLHPTNISSAYTEIVFKDTNRPLNAAVCVWLIKCDVLEIKKNITPNIMA